MVGDKICHIHVILTEEEYNKLLKVKGNKTWKELLMALVEKEEKGIKEEESEST